MPKKPDNPLQAAMQALNANQGGVTEWELGQRKRLVAEKLRRECEGLRLYEPLEYQDRFHQCPAQQALIQKGNRVGGTIALMVEIARAVTGQDPYGKYPVRDGRAVLLGYGEHHIGRVFYDKLFRPGAFRIIRDLETGKWRTFRSWDSKDGGDNDRLKEAKPSPPLIPQRMIDGKPAWVKRSERVFSIFRFTTGWELHATNSAGDPGQAQGFSVNLYGIDEDLATSGWYEEAIGRIADCGGFIRWSALPHSKNDDMMQLVNLAEQEQEKPNPTAVIIRASIFDNKYLPKASVEKSVTAWKSQGEDIYRKRALGEININSALMYPTFNRRIHDVMNVNDDSSPAQRILAERMGEPPDDWTRYVSIDPGFNTLAIEFLAVPPPELGDQIFLFDESYIKEPAVPVKAFGDALQLKCSDRVIEAYIFDMHGGKLRSIASGETPVELYRAELTERRLASGTGGYSFRYGCDDIGRREEAFRSMLAIQRSGQPRFMVVVGKCPGFCTEMEKFKKKTVKQWGKEVAIDKGDRRVNTHAIEAVEQSLGLDLPYIKPKHKSLQFSMVDSWKAFKERLQLKRRMNGQLASPSISLGPVGVGS
jgi:hypothetical protein